MLSANHMEYINVNKCLKKLGFLFELMINGLGKEFSFKKNIFFAECFQAWHSSKSFFKKIYFSCRVPPCRALDKEFFF